VLLLILAKLKWILVALKFSKLGVTTISMLVSAVAYGLFFGWAYGIGFVLLILVHEMGHVWAARLEGIKVSAPMFIPFMGAVISMRERPNDSLAEAKIAAGGPILGSLGALACFALYGLVHQPILLALAYIGFFLNLFNLVPVSPLDGGRILGAASKWALVIGLPILAVFALTRFNPFLLYFLILGALEVWRRFTTPDYGYYKISPAARWGIVAGYVILAASVAWGMSEAHAALQSIVPAQGAGF
jgi:Zn-dependent protease